MAKYIDDIEDYQKEFDQNRVYEYIYHITNMLAHKSRFFNDVQSYDYFSIYVANIIFMKITNKNTKPIKSILNYLKKSLYFFKLDFEQEHYSQSTSKDRDDYSHENLRYKINKTVDTLHTVEFETCLADISQSIKGFLKTIEYNENHPLWHTIYINCLINFLNSITLNNRNRQRLRHLDEISLNKDYLLEQLIQEEGQEIILYHLDNSMYNYMKTLMVRVKHAIALDLCSGCHQYISTSANMKNLLLDTFENELEEDY
jgi:hypothetical protein